MKVFGLFLILIFLFASCDETRLYESNIDFESRQWLVQDKPVFTFVIPDTTLRYTLYCNVRNTEYYPNARLFFTYYLQDSTNQVLKTKLVSKFLFDSKTGAPFGSSVMGDIFAHQIPLLQNHRFQHTGNYSVVFEQFMRTDTLEGILTVGLRVERSTEEN